MTEFFLKGFLLLTNLINGSNLNQTGKHSKLTLHVCGVVQGYTLIWFNKDSMIIISIIYHFKCHQNKETQGQTNIFQ